MSVRRLRVINQYSLAPGDELFSIQLLQGTNATSDGNIVEQCEVSHCLGASFLSIVMNGNGSNPAMSGIIQHNRVLFSSDPTNGVDADTKAIGCSYLHDSIVEGNYVENAETGTYAGDRGSNTNLLIAHNTFINCKDGTTFREDIQVNITIAYNTFEPAYYQVGDNSSSGVILFTGEDGATYTNVVVIGNTAKPYGVLGTNANFLNVGATSGLIVANNCIDDSLTNCTNCLTSCTNIHIYDNTDLQGRFYTNINQIEPPNGLTEKVVTTSSYSMAYNDRYIGVNCGTGSTLTLPATSGSSGKEYIITDESGMAGTYPVSIVPTSPSTINGASSVSISANYGSKTIISDGANWFAR